MGKSALPRLGSASSMSERNRFTHWETFFGTEEVEGITEQRKRLLRNVGFLFPN
jgi:hypothetical protein